LLVSLFIPLNKIEKKYEDIQITLSPVQSVPVKTQPKQTAQSLSKNLNEDKTYAKKNSSTAQPATLREEKIVQSVEQLMKEQSVNRKKVVWDESLFTEDFFETKSDVVQNNNQNVGEVKKIENPFSGTAAKIENPEQKNVKAVSTIDEKVSQQNFTESISEKSGTSFEISSTQKDVVAVQTINGQEIFWGNTPMRKLISPKNPELTISKENQKLINASKNLVLEFLVLENGFVSPSSFTVKPSSSLPQVIVNELRRQVMTWKFEADSRQSNAKLNYRIIVVF
jgi:hypothetical protein